MQFLLVRWSRIYEFYLNEINTCILNTTAVSLLLIISPFPLQKKKPTTSVSFILDKIKIIQKLLVVHKYTDKLFMLTCFSFSWHIPAVTWF